MKFSDFSNVELPSNRKFGFFFATIFMALAGYFLTKPLFFYSFVFAGLAILFGAITMVRADILLPLNKLWMRFGLLLGMIVSPLVLGAIFFFIFTPMAVLMRLLGRDELKLKGREAHTYWKEKEPRPSGFFTRQF